MKTWCGLLLMTALGLGLVGCQANKMTGIEEAATEGLNMDASQQFLLSSLEYFSHSDSYTVGEVEQHFGNQFKFIEYGGNRYYRFYEVENGKLSHPYLDLSEVQLREKRDGVGEGYLGFKAPICVSDTLFAQILADMQYVDMASLPFGMYVGHMDAKNQFGTLALTTPKLTASGKSEPCFFSIEFNANNRYVPEAWVFD